MIWTSCRNASTCVLLSKSETDPQLRPQSTRLCGKGRLSGSCGLLFPSHLGWTQVRSWENNYDSHHWNKVTELGFSSLSLCLVPREGPLQPVPGAPRGTSGRRLRWQVAAGRDVQSARGKTSFELFWDASSVADMSVAVIWWSWESLSLQWTPSAGAPAHPRPHFPLCSSFLIPASFQAYVGVCMKQTYVTSSHRSYWNEKQLPIFCQLVHTSCMAHLWCIDPLAFRCSLMFAVHSENLRLNRGGISLHSVTSKWLSDFWGFQILVGRICEKPFRGSGSLFGLSNCSGGTSSSRMICSAVRLQLKQSCLYVCTVSLVSHVIFAHPACSLFQVNNIPNAKQWNNSAAVCKDNGRVSPRICPGFREVFSYLTCQLHRIYKT